MPQSKSSHRRESGLEPPSIDRSRLLKDRWFDAWITIRPSRQRLLLPVAAAIGAATGYGALLFRYLINGVKRMAFPRGIGMATIEASRWYKVVLPPGIGGLIVGPFVHLFAPEAKGHGVPEVMHACAKRGGRIRPRVALVKTLASAITIGSGGSVGREGPIVQIGSAIGSGVGQLVGLRGQYLKDLVAAGAASGLAAAFNAPITGVIFSLEIILGRGNARHFSPMIVASVIATMVSRHYVGNEPAFEVAPYDLLSAWELPLYALLGVCSALVGVAFTRLTCIAEDVWDGLPTAPATKGFVGGAIVGALAIWQPAVLGNGYEQIENILHNKMTPNINMSIAYIGNMLLLVAVKIFATSTTVASGGSGGVFAPSLFLGAALGGGFGTAANVFMPRGKVAASSAYALVAMGAVVASTTHAPLQAIMIVFEMTNRHTIILPLMLSCILSTTMAIRLAPGSIYTTKLQRRGSMTGATREAAATLATPVRELTRPVEESLNADTPVSDIVDRAINRKRSYQYVTDAQGHLIGVVSMEDIANLLRYRGESSRANLTARDVMQDSIRAISADQSLEECVNLLDQQRFEEIPVLGRNGKLKGRIRRSEIIAHYNRELLRRDAVMSFVDDAAEEQGTQEVVQLRTGEIKEKIPVGGPLLGRSLGELKLRNRFGINVYAIRDAKGNATLPDPDRRLKKGETLVVIGHASGVRQFRAFSEQDG